MYNACTRAECRAGYHKATAWVFVFVKGPFLGDPVPDPFRQANDRIRVTYVVYDATFAGVRFVDAGSNVNYGERREIATANQKLVRRKQEIVDYYGIAEHECTGDFVKLWGTPKMMAAVAAHRYYRTYVADPGAAFMTASNRQQGDAAWQAPELAAWRQAHFVTGLLRCFGVDGLYDRREFDVHTFRPDEAFVGELPALCAPLGYAVSDVATVPVLLGLLRKAVSKFYGDHVVRRGHDKEQHFLPVFKAGERA